MNKSNRHNLIAVLASLIAVVMIFGMAVVLGGDLGAYTSGNESESASNIYDSSEDTKVESAGWVSGGTNTTSGYRIYDESTLKAWLSAATSNSTNSTVNSKTGYVDNDNITYNIGSDINSYNISSGWTLNGNGHTIKLTLSSVLSGSDYYLRHYGKVGIFVQNNQGTISNLNFVYEGRYYTWQGDGTKKDDTWIGIVCGQNNGLIQDVSVECRADMYFKNSKGGNDHYYFLGGIVGWNNSKLNNVFFNLNNKYDGTSRLFKAEGYGSSLYPVTVSTSGIAGENSKSGTINGATFKTTTGTIEARGSGGTRKIGGICAHNNGKVYGHVIDGQFSSATGGDYINHSNGNNYYWIDVHGANYANVDIDNSNSQQWDWYFTGEGESLQFHLKKKSVASGEYVYRKLFNGGQDGDVLAPTEDVEGEKWAVYTAKDMANGTYGLDYYYRCRAYADYTFNGTQYYFDKASEGSKSFSFVYDYNAIPEVAIKYYRLDDSGNRTSTAVQTISRQQASIGAVTVTDDTGIAYNASGTRDYAVATNSAFTLTVVPRNVYIEMPDFIYNKTTGEYYDGTSSTGTAVVASGTPSGADIFNKIYAAISCDSNPGYDSTTVQTVNSTTHPGATAISSASELIAFLNKETTGDIGYLTTNISITSSDLSGNYFNDKIAQGTKFVLESGSQLYGNGKTITLTYDNGSEWGGNNTIGTVSTFIKENYGLIRDINYTFAGTSIAGLGAQDSYFGLFVGQNASSGVIRNVSVTNTGYVAYHMTPSGYKFYAGVAVGRNDGIIGSLSVTMNSSSGNNAFEIGGPGSGEAYCGGVVGLNAGSAYMLKYTWTNGALRATSQGYYGNATNLYISTICPFNQGSIYGMTLSNVTQTKVGLNASSSIVSFGPATTGAYLDYYCRNNGSSAVSTFNYGEGFQLGKLPSSYFTNIMDVSGYIKDVNSTVYTEKRALKYNNIGKYDYCNDALASAYGSHTINIVNTAGYYIVGEVLFDFGTYYHKQSADENVDGYTYTKYEKQLSEDSVVNNAITISSGDNSWLTLDNSNYDAAIINHAATPLNRPWEPVAVLNKSRMNVNNGMNNGSQACGKNIIDLISYSVDTTIYVSKKVNSLNVYDLSTTPYTANVTWDYVATSGSDATPKYTFTVECSDTNFKGIAEYYDPKFAIAGKTSNTVTLSGGSFASGTFSFSVSDTDMQTAAYYGSNETFDLNGLYLYDITMASSVTEANREKFLKAFLAGDATTSRVYAGAQTLTLGANLTISSALSTVAVFNQYKTLDGAGYTITINTPVGGNYASNNGTTYSTPGYPTNVIGYTNYVYRGGLAAVSCGTIQNVNIVLGGDLGTSTANAKSYAIGGVVGLNQGGSFSNVKVTVASNQTIGALTSPAVWGTMIGISSGGSIHDITIGGDRNKTITNNSGNATHRSYIGGVVGVMNLTDNDTNVGAFMGGSSLMFGSLDIAQPSAFNNIYNMYTGSYVGANAFKGLVTGVSYVSGKTPNIATLNNIVYFNKSDSAVPFFSLNASGKHDASILSAYGALGQDDSTAISLTNSLMRGVGITLKYKESYSTGADVLLDMLDYTVSGTSLYFNRTDVRNLAFETNSKVSGVTSNGTNAYVTFDSNYFNATSSATNTNQITAVLTMSLAVTTADGLNDFLKGTGASEPLMAIVNGIDVESDITINAWSNSTLLKVDANRTLNGGNHTVTMNLTSNNKVYADYSSSDNWNGYKLVYDLMGVNNGTIQNLKFAGQVGNFSAYNLAVNHIIGSLVAVNNGTINGVTYINNGIGTYNNSHSANVNTIAGLVAGVNTGAISSTNVFNRALFSVFGMFGGSVGVAMGAIAGVNDGGYATTVKVFGDKAIELVSKTAKQATVANNNTALYVGGVFGVASNDGAVSFATKTIGKHSSNAVISNANIIVAGGMGIRYSGGAINTYGSRGIFAGIVTSAPANTQPTMSGLAFMDMQTGPNLAVSYVYDAGVLSYFASDRIFNNSLSNGELTMMGYSNYVQGDSTACVSGGKVDIFDSHGNSVFMYNYDVTTTNSTLLGGLISYMESGSTLTFDLQNISSYMALNDYITKSWSSLGDALETSGINPTLLRFFDKIGRADFADATTNNVVGGAKYKFSWSIDPSRVTGTGADEIKSNIIKGFIEGKTAQQYRVAGAATALTLGDDVTVNFDGMSAGRVLESTRQIIGNSNTLTINVGNDTLNINDTNADNLYAIEGYDVVGVGGLFAAILGTVLELNIVVNITGGTINATGTNLAVGGVAGIISGTAPTFGYVQVNYNGTTVAFDDGGKTLAFGGIFGAMYTKDGGTKTSVSLKQDGTNQVNMVGVTMTGNAQNVAVGGAVGLMQGSVLQGTANPTVLYLNQNSTTASGFDFTSTVGFSGTGGLGGLVGILAGSNLLNINIDQGMSYAGTDPSNYKWTKDMVWIFNGGSGSAVSAMGGAVGVSFGGVINVIGVNSRARLINNAGTGAGDTTYNYTGGLLALGSNGDGMSLTGTADAYTETINGKTYTLNFTKINNVYAGQIGMIAMPDGGYAGYVTGRYINDTTAYGDNLRNLVWIDFTRKQADLFSKIQVFGATDTAGITLSNVAGMSVLGYVPTDKYNTLIQAGYNKSGYSSDSKLATYSKITACDFKGKDISIAVAAYMSGGSLNIRLIGTLTTGGGGYTPYSTELNVTGTEYLKSWTAQVVAADNKTGQQDVKTIGSGVLNAHTPYSNMSDFTNKDSGGKHNNLRIQLFRNEVIITTEAQLKEFISSDDGIDGNVTGYANATAGTLGANITLTQDVNYYKLNKDLYGNNYTITLVAETPKINVASFPLISMSGTPTTNNHTDVFGLNANETPILDTDTRIAGLFVGALMTGKVIEGVNFYLNSQVWVVTGVPTNYTDRPDSLVGGLVTAINLGTISNCKLELGANANYVLNRTIVDFNGYGDQYSQSNMCIAGGFAGMNIGKGTSYATIENCTLNMDDSAIFRSICEARRFPRSSYYPKAQAIAGGMVGWVGARSNLVNSTLNGGGLIEASTRGVICFDSVSAWSSYGDVEYVRQNILQSGAGALLGVNTNNYVYTGGNADHNNTINTECVIYDANGNYTGTVTKDYKTAAYTNVRSEYHQNVTVDGVIINWYGFTIERIYIHVDNHNAGGLGGIISDVYDNVEGMQTVDETDRPILDGGNYNKGKTSIIYGYRQIAGICDWEKINNAYLVSGSEAGTTPAAGIAGWESRDHGTGNDHWSYFGTALPGNKTIPAKYVGRGGVLGATKSSPFELYVYDNTDPNNLILKDKTALGTNIGLSWNGTGKDADLSFDFTIADPTAEGKFLWDTQVWQVRPNTGDLLNAKPTGDGVVAEGEGWTINSDSNYVKDASGNRLYKKLLFYNDVYDKINNLSDAIHYADVSHTFERGNNVYLYYSYGTTGSASIDRNEYYYDANTGVYYHKTTTSYGNNFNMPALKFYGADGKEITNSSVSNTLFSSILVHRFTGTDPTYEDGMTAVATTPVKDGSGNTIGVNVNDPAAGSYRISFDTESNANVTSAIKDISSKTIIFPENDIVSGKFKIVEIVTPLGLRAGDMTFIAEKGASASSTTNLHLDVAQILVGGVNVLSGNGNYNYNGINYASKIDGIKPASMTTNSIGMTNVTLNLEDWEYYGYVPATNSLGTNRSYLIAGSGFTLEYDFEEANNNSYTKLDGTNVKFEVSGSQVTLQGRGLVIPVDSKIDYVQKTYNGTNTTSGATVSYGKVLTNSTAGTGAPSFDRYDDANAGNNKTVYMSMSRITFDGYKYKIDRYYQSSGFAMRAASANSNSTIDNWKNSVDVEASPKSSHQFANEPLAVSGSGALKTASSGSVQVKLIGTILPQEITVKYIAKEYDGTTTIDYSNFSYTGGTNGLKPAATFGTANVVYGGQGKYNSIVFSDVTTIVDRTDSSVRYALSDTTYGHNYAIANNGTYNDTAKTFTLPNLGVIVPQAVQVTKAKKTYDGSDSFVSGMTYTLAKVSNASQSVTLSDMGLSSLSSSNGSFADANAGDGKTITIKGTTTFQYPDSSLSTEYGARYFATSTTKNYAYSATTYATGVIIPKQLTWKSNIKDLVYKIYDGTTSYTYASASALFDGLVSGDTTTKPTITFASSDVKTAGVGISIATTRNAIDSTYYDQVNGYTNYYMPTSTATGMILPATVTFSGITKVYDGNTDITDTVYANMTTTVTNSSKLTGVKLNPVGAFDGRHAYQTRQVEWTTTPFTYNATTYNILQDAKTPTGSGKNYAGNYCVAGNSNADITPCTLTQADFLGVTAKQNKSDGTTNATGLTFVYFAGAVYLVSGNVKKKNNDDNVDGAYALYKSSSLATTNTDGTYDVGTYDINVTALTGADAGNYTLAVPFDLGQDLVISQQEVNSVAITVMPTNKDYGADLPTATANGWSAKDSVTGGEISGLAFSISAYQWVDDSNTVVTKNSPIGGYNLKVTGITMSGNDNYKLATGATYSVTVTPSGAKALYILPLENTISKVEKVYDGNTNLGTVTATKTISNYVGNYVSKNVQGYNAIAMGNVNIKVITFTYYDNTGAQQTKYVIATGNATTMSNYYLDATPTDGYAILQVGVITPKEVTIGTVSITQSDSRGVVANDTKSAPGNFEYYSSATYSYSATISGVIGGDTVGVSITDPCGGVYNADTYGLTFNGLTGADAGNYEFKGTLSAQLIIKPQTLASVSVSVKPINVVYGNAIPTTIDGATAAATDKKSGAGVTANFTISGFSTTATSTSPIDGYDITIDYSKVSLTGTTNYVIVSTTTINVTVTPAEAKALYIIPADATINSVTKTYDGTTAFTGATIVTNPASITVTGTYADKNAGTGKSVNVDVATFSYYNTQGTAVSVDIFKDTNYKVANTHTTNASVATIDGVGVINKYAIKGSEITGVTVTQTWKGNTSTDVSFTYYTSATYVAAGTFSAFAVDDTVTVTLGIYKSGEGYNDLTGTTGINVGDYKVYLKAVASTPSNYEIAASQAIDVTFTIIRQEITNVNVVGAHYAAEYTGGDLTYDTQQANFEIYAIDADGAKVDITGGVNGVKVGKDSNYANSQTQVGRYNVKVSVNGSAQGNYVFNTVLTDIDVVIAQGSATKTEFAIYPKTATLAEAHKVYDGNNTLVGATVVLNDANSNAINFGDGMSVCASFGQVGAGNSSFVFDTEVFQYYASGETNLTSAHRIKIKAVDSDTTTTTNYQIGSSNTVSDVAYIEYRPVTVTVQGKVYDGTTAVSGAVTDGIVAGETVKFEGEFVDCNAGTGKEVRVYTKDSTLRNGTKYRVLTTGGVNGALTNYCIAADASFTGDIAKREFTKTDLSGVTMIRNSDSSEIEIYPTANTAEYSSAYQYLLSAIKGSVAMDGATKENAIAGWDWTLTLYQESEPNLAISVQMFKGSEEIGEDGWAQNAGTYTVKIALSGDNYFTTGTIDINFVITKQKVDSADNISVFMNSFDGEYGTTGFDNPSASDKVYKIGIKDKISGEIVPFVKGEEGHTFAIASLAFSKTADGTPQAPITATEGVYIGAYYLFAASVTGASDNYDTAGLTLDGKAIFGIDNTSEQSMYFIKPALLNVTSVTKTYDGNTDTATATFAYNGGKTEALSATYASHMSTHNSNGSLADATSTRTVNFKTSAMNVATSTGNVSYAIALKADGTTYTNYYVDGVADGNGYIAVDGVGIIKKFVITDGVMTLEVKGYLKDNKELQPLPLNKDTTATFVYADGYTYDGSKFTIKGLKPTQDKELFNASDNVADMEISISGTIKNAGSYTVTLDRLVADNYEMTGATLGTIVVEKQIVTEDRVVINIPYLVNTYNGAVQKPESSDQFSFVVKDYYTDRDVKSNTSSGGGLSAFKYYSGDYVDGAATVEPKNIGRYSVSVVVDTSFIDAANYTFDGSVTEITKFAQEGKAVYFILPIQLSVTGVYKEYDGTTAFGTPIVVNAADTTGAKTIITLNTSGILEGDADGIYAQIIAASGYFADKNIKVSNSQLVGGDVKFRVETFQYYDEAGNSKTAYYINNTNYAIAGTGAGSYVTVSNVGIITPVAVGYTSLTKTYDGTNLITYKASADYNKTTEVVSGKLSGDSIVGATGYYYTASAGVGEVGTGINVYLQYQVVTYKGISYYTLVNDPNTTASNAGNYYVFSIDADTNVTYPASGVHPTDEGNGYVKIAGIGEIKKVAINIGGSTTTENGRIYDIKFQTKSGAWYAYNNTSAFVYRYNYYYGVNVFTATIGFNENQKTATIEYDGAEYAWAYGINGDKLYFKIYFNNNTSTVKVSDADDSYTLYIQLVEVRDKDGNVVANSNYELTAGNAGTFKINKQELGANNVTLKMDNAVSTTYNGKANNLTVAQITGISGAVATDQDGKTVSLGGTITATDFAYVGDAPINAGGYQLTLKVSGLTSNDPNYSIKATDFYNVSLTGGSDKVYTILPKEIKLASSYVKNFDGTTNFVVDTGIVGEKLIVGGVGEVGTGTNALAGGHAFAIGNLDIVSVLIDADSIANAATNGFNTTLVKENGTIDFAKAMGNYTIAADSDVTITINSSNIVVAERRYDGTSAEIEVAITGLAGTQFLNNTLDKTNLAGVLKISVNSFASFELATTDEIVESSIKKTESLDALGYSSYTITFKYKAKGTLDAATYTDRYVFAVAGATDGYSTNLALTSSELADGQMGGVAITTGTAVANAEALATALKANADIHLTANIYGWDASLLDSAITYTGTLQGNGYSIQLVGGLNGDATSGGAFIASLGGTIRDVNFKFTSAQTLSATNVGLVVGNMAGNMTNVSLDIINTPTIDGATTIGGLAGTASGRMTNATVIFNASVDNTAFGGLAGSATGVTFTNVSVRGYNGKTTTGKTLVATSSGCTFNGVIDMIGGTLGASNITNLYTVNALATGAKANGKLELLTPHTEGFIEYYFTTLNKTGVKTHNVYGGGASERDKTMYQTYGTIATNDTVALAIETLAPRNRFIWEAYSHSYQTEVAGGGHVNLSLNRYVAFMPIGTVIAKDGYTLDGQSKTDMSFITVDVTMFRHAIGIRGSQEIAASGSIIKEVEYTGGQISHEVSITVDGKVTSVSVSGVDAGYYDNIVVELTGDVTTDDINYDTTNRTAVVAKIDDGATVAGAILIIYPKQSALPTDFSKYYDTTSIGEFTTTIDGKSVTLLGTYVDNTKAPASDVGTSLVSFANTLNPIRNVLVDKDGNYIAQHHKTEADGKTTFSYTKISVTTTGGIESYFTTSTDFSTINKNSLMKAIAQLIDYDKATTNDATLVGNANYTNAWVYNVTAIKAADSADGYFDSTKGYFFVPKTIGTNAGNVTFTADGLAVGSLNNIYIGATEPVAFAVLAGTTSSNASILPAQLGATYTGDLEQCFRSTSLSTNIALTKGEWVAFTLPTTMTEAQRNAFNTFKTNASVAIAGTAILGATSGISKNGNVYTADHDNNTVYLQLDLPTQFAGINENGVNGTNYVIKPTAQVLKLRYFFKEGDKYILETYNDVLMIGKAVGNSDYHTLKYVMKNNINMKSSLITPFDWGNGIAFAGTIDGAGYALTNYILKGENNVGLFATMGATASVTNLVMGNVMVVATATTGDVTVSALTTSNTGTVTDVATEMRVVTATTGSVSVANAGESFVRVHKQSASNKTTTVTTLLNGTTKDTYLTPSDIYALTKFGATNAERVSNFLGKYVLNNTKLTYTATDAKITIGVNNFREYWGWYNICPWLEGLNAEGKTWNGIRPTKTNTTQTVTQ